MDYFFYEGEFYNDYSTLLDDLGIEEKEIPNLPDDWCIEAKECDLEPIVTLSAEWIMERVDDDRFSEDGGEYNKAHDILANVIDFDKVNALMPKLYYESNRKFKITKADLLNLFTAPSIL